MARLLCAAALLALAAHTPAYASEPSEDVLAAANEAGVDVIDLMGAVNTTHMEPREYLQAVDELAPPPPPVGVWDRLAACESGGNWATNTGNGFAGGLQFTPSTWRAYGGVGQAHHASRAQQIAVAERVQVGQGWAAWPTCSRRLGLRR